MLLSSFYILEGLLRRKWPHPLDQVFVIKISCGGYFRVQKLLILLLERFEEVMSGTLDFLNHSIMF